jgi:hypothetical protein
MHKSNDKSFHKYLIAQSGLPAALQYLPTPPSELLEGLVAGYTGTARSNGTCVGCICSIAV